MERKRQLRKGETVRVMLTAPLSDYIQLLLLQTAR